MALLAILLFAAAPAAGAPPDASLRQAVETYLGSIDTPIPPARWKALGPGAPAVLAAVARDSSRLPSSRARAVSALAEIGGPEAVQVAEELAFAEGPFAVRVAALEAVGRVLSPGEVGAALSPVVKGAKEARVRAAAALALARHGTAGDCALVRAQAEAEAGNDRLRYARALAACGD